MYIILKDLLDEPGKLSVWVVDEEDNKIIFDTIEEAEKICKILQNNTDRDKFIFEVVKL